MSETKIAALREEIESIRFADLLHSKRGKDCSLEANAEYKRRRERLQEITRELARLEKNSFAAERLRIR